MILTVWTNRELHRPTQVLRNSNLTFEDLNFESLMNKTKVLLDEPLHQQLPQIKQYKLPRPDCSGKVLIYECTDATRVCGGLGDRERGMVSTFLLALLTNRTFVVNHTRGCSISTFFKPNIYDWSKCILDDSSTEEPLYVEDIDGIFNLPDFETLEKGDIWKERAVIVATNAILNTRIKSHPSVNDTIPWVFHGNREYTTNLLFNVLFKLRPNLDAAIERFINDVTENRKKLLIGLHIRRAFVLEQDIPNILKTMDKYSNASKYTIYLATEIRELRDYANQQLQNSISLKVIDGIILNVNRLRATCASFYYAIFEQQILSRTDILYKTESEFSRLAYMIRGKRAKVYEFMRDNGKLFAKRLRAEFPDPYQPVFV